MKKLPELLASVAFLGLSIGAATPELIRWTWNNQPVMSLYSNDKATLQFGLRNDGVVVWREIHPATTNSPAEDNTIRIDPGGTNSWTIPPWQWTNIVITNIQMTNKIIYTPNGMTPENTNDWGKYRMKLDMTTPVRPSTPFEAWLMSLEKP